MKKIIFPTNDGVIVIPEDDISFVKSDNIYAYIYNGENEFFTTSTLKEIQGLLNVEKFYRCHRSYIVNLTKIHRVTKQQNCTIILTNGMKVPVSRNNKKNIIQKLKNLVDHVALDDQSQSL